MKPFERSPESLRCDALESKIEVAESVIAEALSRAENPVVLYTGGKDSTVLLWLVRQVGGGGEVPGLLIDHGLHFAETWKLVEQVEADWNLKVVIGRNQDVLVHAGQPGSLIRLAQLNSMNQREAREVLGYHEQSFPFSLDTEIGNHLLKTMAMRSAIDANGFDYAFVGIRWDEHEARSDETFLSPRSNPLHTRVHPILAFSEADIWSVMRAKELPTHPLYEKGYRSLDSIEGEALDSRPAWEQTLGVGERAGREQDKEGVMERLRALGYM